MNPADVVSFRSDSELAQAVAGSWLDDIAAAQRAGRAYYVALSGGRIALKFFAAAAVEARARDLSLANVEFFWADERCVPPHDSDSNFAAADRLLFQPLGLAPEKIRRIRGEESPAFAARQAEAEICRLAPLNDNGQPVLDLVLLGLGEDGHVASLFPGEPEALSADPAVYRAISHSPKPPPQRITLGYLAIASARQVWVLASGAGKEASLRQSLEPGAQTPLARVLRMRSGVKIFSDLR